MCRSQVGLRILYLNRIRYRAQATDHEHAEVTNTGDCKQYLAGCRWARQSEPRQRATSMTVIISNRMRFASSCNVQKHQIR